MVYESNTTAGVVAEFSEVEKSDRSGWLKRNWIRAVLVVFLIAAVPAYVLLQPKNCQPAATSEFGLREARTNVEMEPEMAESWDAKNDLTATCTDIDPPLFWEHYDRNPTWKANHNCELILQNGQCWWAVNEHHYCRKTCGMCRDIEGCDDAQPPNWWQQKTCADIVSRGDCWWATKEPLNLCRRSCNACRQVGQCSDNEPPSFWTSPASSCREIATTDFAYGGTQCAWASLAPHNLCRKTCGRCENSMCPQASCSRGVVEGSETVVLTPTHFYMTHNTLNKPIIRIPAGSVNVNIKSDSHWPTHEWNQFSLHSNQDLDVCIRDEEHPHCQSLREPCRNYGSERCTYLNDCIVGSHCGQVVADRGGSGNYNGMQITYSGDDNINGIYTQNDVNNDGFETITIRGPTTQDLWVDISSDNFSKGQVSWSFELCDGSCTGHPPTNRPTPEPTQAPVDCDDRPPPSFWAYSTCQDVKWNRQCQWAASAPHYICRRTCGYCVGQLVAPMEVHDDSLEELIAPLEVESEIADEPVEMESEIVDEPLKLESEIVEPPVPARRRRADLDVRRRLADKCEPKYPVWPGLLLLGSAALFVVCVPTKWISKKSANVEPDVAAPPTSSRVDDEDPEVVIFARGKKSSGKPKPPKLGALRKISSGELTGRQASLPKITSPTSPRGPPPRRKEGKWSF